MESKHELATLAGGCFWCIEAVFKELRGVSKVESGYSGGTTPNPTYRQVCDGTTGHAEAVQVTFDPAEISYKDLLNVFFSVHDPTTLNRQGADVGTQYRSVIFYHSMDQEKTAKMLMDELDHSNTWDNPIVTQIQSFEKFYKAEDYHQDYFANNPNQPYCSVVVAPKVAKFRKHFLDKLKK